MFVNGFVLKPFNILTYKTNDNLLHYVMAYASNIKNISSLLTYNILIMILRTDKKNILVIKEFFNWNTECSTETKFL